MLTEYIYAGLTIPFVYLALSGIGSVLKHRFRVPLGVSYLLLCIGASVLIPLSFVRIHPELSRGLIAATTLSGTFVLIDVLRHFYWDGHVRRLHGNRVPEFVRQVINLNILGLVGVGILYFLYDYRIPGLLAGSGIAALILGLAVQDLLGNIIAGYAVHSEKAFRPGDWLLWEHQHVQVVETNWRATRLRNNDDVYLDIPNSVLAKSVITNFTYPAALHALRLTLPVDRAASPSHVKDVLHRAARGADGVLGNPAPKVFLVGFTEWSATYEIKIWLEDHSRHNEIVDAVRTNAWYELQRARIAIPQPGYSIQIARRGPEISTESSELAGALTKVPLLQPLTDDQRDRLVGKRPALRFGRGERIVEQGSPGSSMFVLLSGRAEVSIRSPDGFRSLPVASLNAGDCFGEMSLLTGENRTATVIATTDSDVFEIVKEDFAEILRENPALAESLSDLAARRRVASAEIVSLGGSMVDAAGPVAAATVLQRLRTFFRI